MSEQMRQLSNSKNLSLSVNYKSRDKLIIEEAIETNQVKCQLSKSLIWGCLNAAILAIIGFDLIDRCFYPWTVYQQIELSLAVLLLLNIFYHLCCYIYYFKLDSTKSLLKNISGGANEDLSFGFDYSSIDVSRRSDALSNITAFSFDRSRKNESVMDISSNNQSNIGCLQMEHSTSLVDYNASTNSRSTDMSVACANEKEFIVNENSLNNYLREYANYEKCNSIAFSPRNVTENCLPIWSHPSSVEPPSEQAHILNNKYNIAYVVSDNGSTHIKNKTSPMQLGDIDFWKNRGINPKDVPRMCDDLRMWISSTILTRIAKEIVSANDHFLKHGYSDLQIGDTSLDRLRKSGNMQNMPPNLNQLLPFLECSNHPDYVVHRILELSKSKCMSDFRWNSGSLFFKGKPWDNHLPTDSALIMHLFATYLDTQLVPLPQQSDGKPFSSQYLSTNISEKPIQVPGKFKIHQTNLNPPCYIFVTDTAINAPSKGRNNLFHTLVLFLHYISTEHNSMLGRVSLGPAGINILWVIGKK